jgi:hypothetical protein
MSGSRDFLRPPVLIAPRSAPRFALPEALPLLLLGLVLANGFALPIGRYMGWFLASLVHEMGHAGMAWICGAAAFPAIRLDGHAAAVHGEHSAAFALFVTAAIGFLAWMAYDHGRPRLAILAGAGVVVQPLIAFTGLREIAFLAAGHLGEIGFAALAFHRVFDAEKSRTERVLYATVGGFLVFRNATLFLGLMTSQDAVIEYYGSGSFGMKNDLLRLAEDALSWSLGSVASWFLLLTLAAPLLVLVPRFFARGDYDARHGHEQS